MFLPSHFPSCFPPTPLHPSSAFLATPQSWLTPWAEAKLLPPAEKANPTMASGANARAAWVAGDGSQWGAYPYPKMHCIPSLPMEGDPNI